MLPRPNEPGESLQPSQDFSSTKLVGSVVIEVTEPPCNLHD